MTSQVLEKEQLEAWLVEPATQAVLMALARRRDELKEEWAAGAFTRDTIEANALLNAAKIGEVNTLVDILTMDHDRYLGWIDERPREQDDEHIGGAPTGARGVAEDV